MIISRNIVFIEESTWKWNDKEKVSLIHFRVHVEVEHTRILETKNSDLSLPSSINTFHASHGS